MSHLEYIASIIDDDTYISAALFGHELAELVRSDYSSVLNTGCGDEAAERVILQAYAPAQGRGDANEATFWFSLAYSEWKKGRLSQPVRERALYFLDHGEGLLPYQEPGRERLLRQRIKVLDSLREMLASPMPERKPVRRAPQRRFPWQEGDLLAWQIIDDSLRNDPFYRKYALIRVVQVERTPVCLLSPEAGYDEVGLMLAAYDWSGNEPPAPETADRLEFLTLDHLSVPNLAIFRQALEVVAEDFGDSNLQEGIRKMREQEEAPAVNCCIVTHEANALKARITLLARDPSYRERIPAELKTGPTETTICGANGFDITLARALA